MSGKCTSSAKPKADRSYQSGFRAGEESAARIIVMFLRSFARPGTQPADYYERAAERIEETYGVKAP